MKNVIWVGKNKRGMQFTCTEKIVLSEDGYFYKNDEVTWEPDVDEGFNCDYTDFFGLNLKNGEIVQVVIDMETKSYEIKRERENGWYLVNHNGGCALAMHWNGNTFCANRSRDWTKWIESKCVVLSGKLPENDYLRSLE